MIDVDSTDRIPSPCCACVCDFNEFNQPVLSMDEEDTIFSKEIQIKSKPVNELFGSEEVLPVPVIPDVAPVLPTPTPSPTAPTGVSKKQRWKEAIREKPVSPLTTAAVTSTAVGAAAAVRPPPIPIRISVDDSSNRPPSAEAVNLDDLAPLDAGCRDSFLPASLPPAAQVDTETPTESPLPCEDPVEHLILVVHGINGSEENLYRNLERMKESFEQVRGQWFKDSTSWAVCHMELINWKSSVIGLQSSLFERITPRGSFSVDSRMFINYAISDVAFYLTPRHCESIKQIVASLLNERVKELRQHSSGRFGKSKIVIVGYSLGSVIIHDILTEPESPRLDFSVSQLFLWGSPLAAYLSVKDAGFQAGKFTLPGELEVFNIYHPHDPVAFRIEPLYYHLDSEIADPEVLPFWENDGLQSSKALERSWEEIKSAFAEQWEDIKLAVGADTLRSSSTTQLVPKRRLDFVLQESMAESLSHKYSMLTAHYSYWASRDVALFMLRKITGLEPVIVL